MDNRLAEIIRKQMEIAEKIGMAAELASKVARVGNAAAEQIVRMSKAIQPFLNSSQMAQGLTNIRNGIIQTEEDIKVFKVAMVEMGYPPHDGMTIKSMRSIAKIYQSDKEELKDNIDEIMKQLFPPSELQSMLLSWEEVEMLNRRLPLLRNVVMAHNIGMYHLVVPSLLSQMEGLLVDIFSIKGRVDGKIQKVMLKHLLLKKEYQSSLSFDEAIHKYYSENILASFTHGESLGTDLSRHAILHGSDTDFGKESISLKVILLFDYLVSVSLEINESMIQEAKKEIAETRKRNRRR